MIDFVDMIFFHADARPEKAALITSENTLTYGMLRRGILSVEQRLRQNGLKPGDRVGIEVLNAIGHMTLLCALHRCGIVSMSIERPQLSQFENLGLDALLTNTPFASDTTRMIPVDESWFNDEPPDVIGPNVAQQLESDTLCRMILSSGTTGTPKVIGLSFEAVQERLISYSVRMSTPSWDRIVCLPGLSTNYGYSFAITTLWLGRTMCFAFDATARQLVMAHQIELMVASTHQISEVVKGQEEQFVRLDTLRALHIGGSVTYAPLNGRIRMNVCNTLYCGYGSTEGGTVAYVTGEAVFGMDRAVGMVAPWIELEVVDDQKKPVPYGKDGEIRLRALGQGQRYKKGPDGRYEIDESEWFYPGDLGVVFQNGLLTVNGRVNEIINRGGTKVAPDKIEEELKKYAVLNDAAVVGVIDDFGIEQIWAAVTSRDGSEIDIKGVFDYCRKALPFYTPDRVFQVKEVPRNRLGKVSRETLKEDLKKLEDSLALALR